MARITIAEYKTIVAKLNERLAAAHERISVLEGAAALAAATPRTKRPASPEVEERRSVMATSKLLATTFRTTIRIRNGKFEAYCAKRGEWRVVPQEFMPS